MSGGVEGFNGNGNSSFIGRSYLLGGRRNPWHEV
jgi:hypothetical protein